jgi:hypothetical protein
MHQIIMQKCYSDFPWISGNSSVDIIIHGNEILSLLFVKGTDTFSSSFLLQPPRGNSKLAKVKYC